MLPAMSAAAQPPGLALIVALLLLALRACVAPGGAGCPPDRRARAAARGPRRRHRAGGPPGPLPALAGIGGPALYGVVTTGAGLLRPGYDPWRQHISDLGVGPLAWLQNANTILLGLLVLALARGLRRGIATGRGAARDPGLIASCGLGTLALGLFPQGPGDGRGGNFLIHSAAFVLCVGSVLLAAFRLPGYLGRDPRWRGRARWSTRGGSLALGGLAAVALADPALLARWGGLLERLLVAGGLGWLACLGLQLLLITRAAPACTAAIVAPAAPACPAPRPCGWPARQRGGRAGAAPAGALARDKKPGTPLRRARPGTIPAGADRPAPRARQAALHQFRTFTDTRRGRRGVA